MDKNRILIIYGDTLTEVKSGTQNRVINILKILKEKGCMIDHFCRFPKNIREESGSLIDKIFTTRKSKISFLKIFFIKIYLKFKIPKDRMKFLSNISFKPHKICYIHQNFKKYIDINKYDYLIIINTEDSHYTDLLPEKTKKILLLEDVMYNQFKDRASKEKVDKYYEEYKKYETECIKKFDKIFAISQNELNLFKDEVGEEKFIYLPPFMENKNIDNTKEKIYDIIYIGHNNPHNIKASKWFLEQVYPKLKDKKILFIGKICYEIKNKEKYKNIDFVEFIENLDDAYNSSKIAICPMFSGTGIKIKVVEALSYGKPVVCNKMGIIGFNDIKNNGILVSDDPEIFLKYINDLLENKNLYDKLSKDALEYFKDNFSKEKCAKILNLVFENRKENE